MGDWLTDHACQTGLPVTNKTLINRLQEVLQHIKEMNFIDKRDVIIKPLVTWNIRSCIVQGVQSFN